MRCLCFPLFLGLHSLGINAPGRGLYEKSGKGTKKTFFFSPPFTLCPLHIPDTGFWKSWLVLLVFLLCCLLFSEGCCWKEDYIIMQMRLYNPEQTVQSGERRGATLSGAWLAGGALSEITNWALLGLLWNVEAAVSLGSFCEYFWSSPFLAELCQQCVFTVPGRAAHRKSANQWCAHSAVPVGQGEPWQTCTNWYLLIQTYCCGPTIKLLQLFILKHSSGNPLWECCSLLCPHQMTWFAVRCRLL